MNPPDEELVRRFQGGEDTAFETLVERWYTPLLNLAWRLTGERDDAEEIRQMALIKIFQGAGDFHGRSRFSTWVYRICLNLVRDRHRKSEVQKRTFDLLREETGADSEIESTTPLSSFERQERAQRVAEAVLSLPQQMREVVVLRHYHDLPFPAIAEVTGAPVTTVKSRMQMGLEKLRVKLQHLEA